VFLTILYVLIALFIVGIIVYALYDLISRFRRHLVSGWHFAFWLVAILVFPVVGSLVYAIVRPAPPLEEST
jgi:Phospholipase_D-nuclease N-terminal